MGCLISFFSESFAGGVIFNNGQIVNSFCIIMGRQEAVERTVE